MHLKKKLYMKMTTKFLLYTTLDNFNDLIHCLLDNFDDLIQCLLDVFVKFRRRHSGSGKGKLTLLTSRVGKGYYCLVGIF